MKKFTALLVAVLLCFSMVVCASAAVEAEPVTNPEIPTTQSTGDSIVDTITGILNNNEGAEDAALTTEGIMSTIANILNSLDDFLRGLRLFVDQFFSNVLGNGSFPI